MAFSHTRGKDAFDKASRTVFLAELARTSNVSGAARAADVKPHVVYRERRRSAAFRAAWHSALCEGYVRLESQLLAEALRNPGGKASEATVKARAAKVRLGMSLLALHRAAVRGERKDAPPPSKVARRKPAEVRLQLEDRFAAMRERMDDDAE